MPRRAPLREAPRAASARAVLSAARVLTSALVLVALGACDDLRAFEGRWRGTVARDPELARGFAPDTEIAATIQEASRTRFRMTLHLPAQAWPGAPTADLPFEPVRGASADALGDLRMMGDPLRTVIGYVRAPDQEAVLVFVSLLADSRVALRLIRGPDELYGLFELRPDPGRS